jgi:hypothetical protein
MNKMILAMLFLVAAVSANAQVTTVVTTDPAQNRLWLGILIGIAAGIIDIIPMIAQKLNKKTIVSAFLQYFFVSVIIVNIDLPNIVWWLEGGLIALFGAIPLVLIVAATDEKSNSNILTISIEKTVAIILTTSIILGTLIGIAGHFIE